MNSPEQEISFNRRELLRRWVILAGAGAVVGVSFPACDGSDQDMPNEPSQEKPLSIEESLSNFEKNYRREDLNDTDARTHELELVAQFFFQKSGRTALNPQQLASFVTFLPEKDFFQKIRQAGGETQASQYGITLPSGQILCRTEGNVFSISTAPIPGLSFTALSVERIILTHEFFHRTVVVRDLNIDLSVGGNKVKLVAVKGFQLNFADPEVNKSHVYANQRVLEEAVVIFLTAKLNKPIDKDFFFSSYANPKVNNATKRLYSLDQSRPDITSQINQFHQNSDFLGFASFLAEKTGRRFNSETEKLGFGLTIISEFYKDPGQSPNLDMLLR